MAYQCPQCGYASEDENVSSCPTCDASADDGDDGSADDAGKESSDESGADDSEE